MMADLLLVTVVVKFGQGGGRRWRRPGRYEMGTRQQSIAHLSGQLFRVDDWRRQRRRRQTLPFRRSFRVHLQISYVTSN